MAAVIHPFKSGPKPTGVIETRVITVAEIESWVLPKTQRPIRMNHKVMKLCEDLKSNGGIITGTITLGQVPNDPNMYRVDGSHRCEAAKMSELPEFIADIRTKQYANLAELAKDSIELNDSLVRMRRDDILRAQEEIEPMLRLIRNQCPFVGYDNVRRASHLSAIVSMSCALGCWGGSSGETPRLGGTGKLSTNPENLTESEASLLCQFLNIAYAAWGNDPEYYRLWANLNLTMCMWLFRQLVLNPPTGSKRHITLNAMQFKMCLMSLSAAGDYLAWLVGRNLTERDRTPCYTRIRHIFGPRLLKDGFTSGRLKFPQPPWARSSGR